MIFILFNSYSDRFIEARSTVCRFLSISNFETASLKKLFITSAHLAESDITSSSSIIVIVLLFGDLSEKKGFNVFPEFHIITNIFGFKFSSKFFLDSLKSKIIILLRVT